MLKKYKMHIFTIIVITTGISSYGISTVNAIDVSGNSKEILSKISNDLKTKCNRDGKFKSIHTEFKTDTGSFGLNINPSISDITIMMFNGTVDSTHTYKCIDHVMVSQ